MSRKHGELAAEIRRTVPKPQLIAAVLMLLRVRHERATGEEKLELWLNDDDLEILVEDEIRRASVRQLKMLREIALSLEGGMQH